MQTNFHISDSYLITDKKMQLRIINSLPPHFLQARSAKSYLREWRAHNWLYDHHLFVSHTKDVDLNIDEKWYRRLAYFFISILYIK